MSPAARAIATAQPPFVAHCVELLAPLGAVRVRRMFGGWGIYIDGLFMALIAFDRLYLKTDAASVQRFIAAGCEPFRYRQDDREQTMAYWTAPAEALDAPPLMEPWARLALQAALTARADKPAPRPRKKRAVVKPPMRASAKSPGATKRRVPKAG